MDRIRLKEIYSDISAFDGKTVTVAGWVRTIRDSKAFGFIELNDGSFFKNMQIVFEGVPHHRGESNRYSRKQTALRNQSAENFRGGGICSRLSVAEKAPFRGIPAGNRLFKT